MHIPEKYYFVYILTNVDNTLLYTGITNNLQRRVLEHKSGRGSWFTRKYEIHKLVYYEAGDSLKTVMRREKQIKRGSRQKKVDLINSINPGWTDLIVEISS